VKLDFDRTWKKTGEKGGYQNWNETLEYCMKMLVDSSGKKSIVLNKLAKLR
jgi:hypothetical protein